MMPNQSLRTAIAKLAEGFADQLVDTLRSMSLDALLEIERGAPRGRPAAAPSRRPGRPARGGRRGAAGAEETIDRIVELLRTRREGMRAEQIRAELGLSKADITRPIAMALESGQLSKKGQRRATTYFAK
jgi:hypothetical protein